MRTVMQLMLSTILIVLMASQGLAASQCHSFWTSLNGEPAPLQTRLLAAESIVELERLNAQSRQQMFQKQISAEAHLLNSYIFYTRVRDLALQAQMQGLDLDSASAQIVSTIQDSLIEMIEDRMVHKYGSQWKSILGVVN